MLVPLWVGRVDPGAAPTGLYVIPHWDLRPLHHDPAANLVTAAQYALGGLQKAGVGALLPPLQVNLCPVGVAFLLHVPRWFQGTQLMGHVRQAPNALGANALGAARPLRAPPVAENENCVKEQANSSTRAG